MSAGLVMYEICFLTAANNMTEDTVYTCYKDVYGKNYFGAFDKTRHYIFYEDESVKRGSMDNPRFICEGFDPSTKFYEIIIGFSNATIEEELRYQKYLAQLR